MKPTHSGYLFFIHWAIAVAVALLPFLILIVFLDFFSPFGISNINQLVLEKASSLIPLTDAEKIEKSLVVEANFILYIGLLLFHCVVSTGLLCYFTFTFRDRINNSELVQIPKFYFYGFLGLFTLGVYVLLIAIAYSQHPFAQITVSIPEVLLRAAGLANLNADSAILQFHIFKWTMLLPVLVACPAIIAASAGFHIVFYRPPFYATNPDSVNPTKNREVMAKLAKLVYSDIMRLSLLLVSATITAHLFFHLVPEAINTDGVIKNGYLAIAEAMTITAGLLFTVTLCATFLPGAVLLISHINRSKNTPHHQPGWSVRETLKEEGLELNFMPIFKIIGAILAPAVAGPLLEVFGVAAAAI